MESRIRHAKCPVQKTIEHKPYKLSKRVPQRRPHNKRFEITEPGLFFVAKQRAKKILNCPSLNQTKNSNNLDFGALNNFMYI